MKGAFRILPFSPLTNFLHMSFNFIS